MAAQTMLPSPSVLTLLMCLVIISTQGESKKKNLLFCLLLYLLPGATYSVLARDLGQRLEKWNTKQYYPLIRSESVTGYFHTAPAGSPVDLRGHLGIL